LLVNIGQKTIFGKYIILGFSRHNNKSKSIAGIKDEFRFQFNHNLDLTFSNGNIYDFNELLEDIYRKDLAFYLAMGKMFNPTHERKRAIEVFNQQFNISEDDIGIETLLKHFQRHPQDMQLLDLQALQKVS